MSELREFLTTIVAELNRAGIPYMLAGSLASSHHSRPRTTHDVDIVIDYRTVVRTALVGFLDRCESLGMYVSRGHALEPTTSRRQFNVIAPSGWKADLMEREERAFSHSEFARRCEVDMLGIRVNVATAEDVILAKLEWSGGVSQRQMDDVVAVIETNRNQLDDRYLDLWADDLGVRPLLDEARARASAQP